MENKVIINSFIWKLMERSGTQIVQFIVQLIIARLLLPSDYGIVGLITIFIAIANVFVQTGFNTALIQKKNVDDLDYSSVFFMSIVIALFLYLLLFLAAPFISDFYEMPVLEKVVRILSLTLFFGAVNSVQIAKISREFNYKKLFKSSFFASALSGLVGIVLAYYGSGVWALVYQQLANQVLIMLIMFVTVDWKPSIKFSLARIRELFEFGRNLLLSNLLDTVYNNIYGLIIGKIFNPSSLGFYNRADQFPKIIVSNINGSLQSVMLSAMSHEQEKKEVVKNLTRKTIQISTFFTLPMMFGLAACAQNIVSITLTDKWLPSVPILQILCFSYSFWPIHTANLQAINALGRSDIYLRLEIIKKVIGIVGILVSIPFGLMGMVFIQPVIGFLSLFINAYPNRVLLKYSFREQLEDMVPSYLTSVLMYAAINLASNFLSFSIWTNLLIQFIFGILMYFIFSFVVNRKTLKSVMMLLAKLH